MRFVEVWHLNCIASFHTHYALQKLLGMHKRRKSNEESWTSWKRDHRQQQLGRRLDACRRADIARSRVHCWSEAACFLLSTATYIVEVISFFDVSMGCFSIKGMQLTVKSFITNMKATCPSLVPTAILKKSQKFGQDWTTISSHSANSTGESE